MPSNGKSSDDKKSKKPDTRLHPDIKKIVLVIVFITLAVLFILAAANQAGPAGTWFFNLFKKFFGYGYYLFPTVSFLLALSFITPEKREVWYLTWIAGGFFVLSGLGFIDIIYPGSGGLTGSVIGTLQVPFGFPASIVITVAVLASSLLILLNKPLKLKLPVLRREGKGEIEITEPTQPVQTVFLEESKEIEPDVKREKKKSVEEDSTQPPAVLEYGEEAGKKDGSVKQIRNYVPPDLSLLLSASEKPTIGDLRANANIIKRTLESFGISVEMGEINIGPTVTRYTLKPAEGMKLSRITALHSDLALALAAHPIRIEAPIPGKSLVGIEVPNKAAAMVRLGNLLGYEEFRKAEPLVFVAGRNVSGEPVWCDIARMPHLLIAGATGSGKSIAIHSLLLSLLFKNSPEMLRFILIDPKRVELSIYGGIPHLLAPVITENKKAIGALRWAITEMERRYEILQGAGCRDIKSYNKSHRESPLHYIVIVIDELADLMASYGREVEGSIIRIAQMARATGIHLIVSTQRPSVEVITGLIKANITSRIALQVASQVDSRTIIDMAGAEKLLGKGDLLYLSSELGKPQRIQGAYVTEEEIKKVISFIKERNDLPQVDEVVTGEEDGKNRSQPLDFDAASQDGDDDELYGEAVEVVREAKKASASLLQRRLKVGYARAARLLDIMEEKGIIGPGDGAKPREVYIE